MYLDNNNMVFRIFYNITETLDIDIWLKVTSVKTAKWCRLLKSILVNAF